MDKTEKYKSLNANFKKAAIYKITVQGAIDAKWSERLWGLQVNIEDENRQISTLVGQINDQAALSGILNALYEMHTIVISVNMLSDIK